jgi:putative ABC transport system substrate-binding protein
MTRRFLIGRTLTGMLFAALLGADAALAQTATGPQPGRTYRIGFSQIIDHPALNATRQGFLEGLAAAGFVEGKNLKFEYLNAQGDLANARNIAERFVADKVDLIAPCTTPNTQAAIKVAKESGIPVVFGCVTNPLESGILAALDKPTGTNVAGIYGIPPVARMFDLLQRLNPKAKIIGTLYNPAESNSVTLNAMNKAEAVKRGLTWAEVQVTSTAEVQEGARALAQHCDTLLMPQDNTVASAFAAVVRVAQETKKPLFSFDTIAVERGAIASYAQDQHQAGVDWAREVAVPVLLGKPAGSIVPVTYKAYDLLLNSAAAKAAGISLPEDLVKSALRVWDK